MKLHKALLKAVADITYQVVFEQAYAERLLKKVMDDHNRWGKRDRQFVVETTQDVLRNYRYLCHLSNQHYADNTINSWHIMVAWIWWRGYELPAWDELNGINTHEIAQLIAAPTDWATKLSLPDWLYEIGMDQLGEQWDNEVAAMNQPAKLVIRVNTLKTTVAKLSSLLASLDIETQSIPNVVQALQLTTRKYLMNLDAYKNGLFEIQDAASQLVAPMVDAQAGQLVIDACAGGGGKTLHLANLMGNKGKIIACDVEEVKLKSLKHRLQRAGVNNTEVRTINNQLVKELHHKADRLLLDVPCSGLGVLKRNPDTKWHLTSKNLNELVATQRQILTGYHNMLKPGGKLLYATCSILPMEDEQQIDWFVVQHPEYHVLEQQYIMPSTFGYDGFYMVLLQKAK